MKKNKAAVKEELLSKLNNFHDKDPQKYWNIFNDLRNIKHNRNDCCISASHWITHYKNLFHKSPDIENEILDQLNKAELDGKQNISLNYGILDKEIYMTLSKI